MRIAIISDGVHPYVIGGMQRHTYYLCKYLSRLGVSITLLHFNKSDKDISKMEIFTEEENKNIESIVIPFPESDKLPGHYLRASHKYSSIIYERLKDRLSEFDFIYTKGFSGWRLIEEKLKSPAGFPPIGVKFHGYEMFQKQADLISRLKSLLLRRPVRWISRNADFVFSYGSGITDIIKSLGVKPERIIEIPAGIESEWISGNVLKVSEPPVFVYLGRYERRKGIEELNMVLKELSEEGKDIQFRFIGPFAENQKLKSEKFIYYGTITDNERIRQILDQADFLVCPSWSEGMPNVIMEAMSRGLAVIASEVGAVPLLVDSDNGFLVKPGDKPALKNAILKALNSDKQTILTMKHVSRNKIKDNFRYEIILERFVKQIKNTIR